MQRGIICDSYKLLYSATSPCYYIFYTFYVTFTQLMNQKNRNKLLQL